MLTHVKMHTRAILLHRYASHTSVNKQTMLTHVKMHTRAILLHRYASHTSVNKQGGGRLNKSAECRMRKSDLVE